MQMRGDIASKVIECGLLAGAAVAEQASETDLLSPRKRASGRRRAAGVR